MPRKSKASQEKQLWTKAKWKGFVPISLNSQEKAAVKEGLLSPEGCWQFVQDMATAGYKVSLSYSIPEDVFTIALTGVYQEKPNAGLTVSQRHKDCDVVASALAFVVVEDGVAVDWEERFGTVADDDW